MSKIYAIGFAALFAAVSIAATTAPASAKNFKNFNHPWHHSHWHDGFFFDLSPLVIDEAPQPVYCVDHRGRLYVCDYN
jgi:hypothetical protein